MNYNKTIETSWQDGISVDVLEQEDLVTITIVEDGEQTSIDLTEKELRLLKARLTEAINIVTMNKSEREELQNEYWNNHSNQIRFRKHNR